MKYAQVYIDSAVHSPIGEDLRALVFGEGSAQRKRAADSHRHDYRRGAAQLRSGAATTAAFGFLVPFGAASYALMKKGGQKWAEPHARVTASELREKDGRDPVVFLRAFTDDRIRVGLHRLEPICQEVASHVGPLIAIGKPGEAVPLEGAARDYFKKGEWQRVVVQNVATSRLIFLMAGTTRGLGWELGEILRQQVLAKMIIVLPPDQSEQRWTQFQSAAPSSLSEMLPSFEVIQNGRALLFAPERPPLVICSREVFPDAYTVALQFAVTQALINCGAVERPGFDLYNPAGNVLPNEETGAKYTRQFNRKLLFYVMLIVAIPVGIWTYGLTVGFNEYSGRIGTLRKAIFPPPEPRFPTLASLSTVADNPYSAVEEDASESFATGFLAGARSGRNAAHMPRHDPGFFTERWFLENLIPKAAEEAKNEEKDRALAQQRKPFALEPAFSDGFKRGFLKSAFSKVEQPQHQKLEARP